MKTFDKFSNLAEVVIILIPAIAVTVAVALL